MKKRRLKEEVAFAEKVRGLLKEEAEDLSLLEWCSRYIKIRGEEFSLGDHPYLEEIYGKHHPYMVFEKGAQVGISTYTLLKSLWLCDTHHAKVIYYFPTDSDVSDFSNDRCMPVIRDSDYLSTRVAGIDNVGLKQIGDSSIYFRGMYSKIKVKSVDADVLVFDELDECKQENKQYALDRILHSKLKWVMELSQPSIPDFGVDLEFKKSDQRFWHIRCSGCRRWVCLEESFPACIGVKKEIIEFACPKCGKKLNRSKGEWIAKYPSRKERRGYHLSQLFSLFISAKEVWDAFISARRTFERVRFYNSLLGFAYAGDRQPLTEEILDRCEGDWGLRVPPENSAVYMGVDVGDLLHVAIGHSIDLERISTDYLEVTSDWARLYWLMEHMGVNVCVIDALPYKNSAKKFARKFRKKVYIQYFKEMALKTREEGEGMDAVPVVLTDRTESLDETVDMLKRGDILIPAMSKCFGKDLETLETFRKHLKMLVKDEVESARGEKKFVYKRNVENHFGMALNSMRIARDIAPHLVVPYEYEGVSRMAVNGMGVW